MSDLKSLLSGYCGACSCGAPYLADNFDRATRAQSSASAVVASDIAGAAPAQDYTP